MKQLSNMPLLTRILFLISLLYMPVAQAINLYDSELYLYVLNNDGSLAKGQQGEYSQYYGVKINQQTYTGSIQAIEAQGREVVTDMFTEPGSGVQLSRRVYVPFKEHFSRYTEVLYNPTTELQTVHLEVFANFGTQNKSQILMEQNHYLVTQTQDQETPLWLHYFSAFNSTLPVTHTLNQNQLSWSWSAIPVPAQSEVHLVYFVLPAQNLIEIQSGIDRINLNSSLLYEAIGSTEREQIINFIPPANQQSPDLSSVPGLSIGETRQAELTETDQASQWRNATPADTYALQLTAGQPIRIHMAATFDSYLYLFRQGSGIELLVTNPNAELYFTPTQTGQYYLEATAYQSQARGAYSLEVKSGIPDRAPLARPFHINGNDGLAPSQVSFQDFSIEPDNQNLQRCWYFGDNTASQCSYEAQTQHTYQQAGNYVVTLRLSDPQGKMADHSEAIKVRDTFQADSLLFNNPVNANLSQEDRVSAIRPGAFADNYAFELLAGQVVQLKMDTQGFSPCLYLYDAYGKRIIESETKSGTSTQFSYIANQDIRLKLEASSFQNQQTGDYSLTLSQINPATAIEASVEKVTLAANPLENYFILRLPQNFEATYFSWQFGDSSQVQGTSPLVSHRYRQAGQYMLQVSAFNAEGRQVTAQKTFALGIQGKAIQAAFIATPLYGEAPLTSFFLNQSHDHLGTAFDFSSNANRFSVFIKYSKRETVYCTLPRCFGSYFQAGFIGSWLSIGMLNTVCTGFLTITKIPFYPHIFTIHMGLV